MLVIASLVNLMLFAASVQIPQATIKVYPGVTFIFGGYTNLSFDVPLSFAGEFNLTNNTMTFNGVYISFVRSIQSSPNANVSLLSYSIAPTSGLQIWQFNTTVPSGILNFATSLVSGSTFYGDYIIDGGRVSTSVVHIMAFDVPASTNHTVEIRVNTYGAGAIGGVLDMNLVVNLLWLIGFVSVLTLGLILAIRIRDSRGGGRA